MITARLAAQEEDGLSKLETSAGSLRLPRIDAPLGAMLRIRIHAQDVIIARHRPEGLSALNILPATVTGVRLSEGPNHGPNGSSSALVQLRIGEDLLLARITRRSVQALDLTQGAACFVILKSMSVARHDVSPF